MCLAPSLFSIFSLILAVTTTVSPLGENAIGVAYCLNVRMSLFSLTSQNCTGPFVPALLQLYSPSDENPIV